MSCWWKLKWHNYWKKKTFFFFLHHVFTFLSLFWDASTVTEHHARVNEWKLEGRPPAPLHVLLWFDWKTFQCKGNTAVLLGKMHHFILSDLFKSLLTLGLVRVEDPRLVLVELCQTVFRGNLGRHLPFSLSLSPWIVCINIFHLIYPHQR